jgi:2-methylisocitrate lyase-like PEP mutase family enzyme
MRTQEEKGNDFRNLHYRDRAFIIPNPWDIGTARLLGRLQFEAIATTSAGFALSLGQLDNTVGRVRMMMHLREMAGATGLPVSADLENGFGDDPETAAMTIRMAAAAGVVGGSIEDSTGRADDPVYELELAVERVRAAAEAAHGLPFPFTLTARAENYIAGRPDLNDTIRRLQAYQQAGADVLYAPGISTKDEITAIVSSTDRPVNVLAGLKGIGLSLAELSDLGVKRVSVGAALTRLALGSFLRAAREMQDRGTFEFADEAASYSELSAMFQF